MSKVIDLTLPIKDHWRWFAHAMRVHDHDRGDLFTHSYMVLNMHGFTHVDAPKHYLAKGATIEHVPLGQWYGEAVVVNLTHIGARQAVTAQDLEQCGGSVRPGDIALLRTDWPLKCDWESMDFWGEGPYVSKSACEWLIAKKVKTVGYDFMPDDVLRYQVLDPKRLESSTGPENTTHHELFPAGITVVEYLVNLHLITKPRVMFYALPLLIERGDGSPVRAVAIED